MAIDTEPITGNHTALFRAPGCIEDPPGFVPFPPEEVEQSLASRFAKIVREHADRVAVHYGGQAITYRELDIQSNRLARTLLARCRPGAEPVALLLGKGIPYFIACLGVWKAGKFVVPLDPHSPQARLTGIYEDVTARCLLSDTANREIGERIAGDGALNLETLELAPCGDSLDLTIDPLTPSAIFYTSGSTGKPKGVVQLQRNLLHSVGTYTNNFKYYPGARIGFAYSLTVAISQLIFTTALMTGAAIYPIELLEVGLDGFAGWLQREEITFLQCVPSLFRRLAPAVPPGMTFPHLRLIVLGGELGTRGDAELFRRHFGGHTALGINYGLTEVTPVRQYIMRPDDVFTELYLPVGYPVPGMDVRVVDDEGRELPPGEIGEIVLRTRYIADGYWRNPEATARAFRADPSDPEVRIYSTGDLGSLQADGCLTCHGRKDFQVKIRGYRVETAEVELALLELPAVKEAVVMTRSDRRSEQYLAAYLVAAGEERPATGEVLASLRERLPDYMVPAAVVWLREMPQTPTGKIDRLALPAPAFDDADAEYEPPRTPLEETLARIWEEVLGVERVGRRESLYDLGGHSLLAPRLFTLIQQRVGQRLPLATLLQAASVAEMAELLSREDWTPPWESLAPINAGGTRLAFFCVHPAGGDILVYRDLSVLLGPDQPFYGFQEALDFSGKGRNTIDEMAAHYVEQLRDFHPDGPYYLGGYSFGGVVAFEMARQLTAQGAEVKWLALFDTTCPILPPTDLKEKYKGVSLLGYLRSRPTSLARAFHRLFILVLFHACRRFGCPFPRRFRLGGQFLFYRMARRHYRPGPYAGGMTLFRTMENKRQDDLGWSALIDGPIDIRSVLGNHNTLFDSGNVEALAAEFRDCLLQAQGAGNE